MKPFDYLVGMVGFIVLGFGIAFLINGDTIVNSMTEVIFEQTYAIETIDHIELISEETGLTVGLLNASPLLLGSVENKKSLNMIMKVTDEKGFKDVVKVNPSLVQIEIGEKLEYYVLKTKVSKTHTLRLPQEYYQDFKFELAKITN